MAARGNIVINDGQVAPVAHTFNPNSGDGNVPGVSVIEYEDRVTGISVGFPVVSTSIRKASKQNKNHKLVYLIKLPVLETLSGSTLAGITASPTKAFDLTFRGEFILPERAVLAQRKDILAYAKNLLANAVVTSGVQDLDFAW